MQNYFNKMSLYFMYFVPLFVMTNPFEDTYNNDHKTCLYGWQVKINIQFNSVQKLTNKKADSK